MSFHSPPLFYDDLDSALEEAWVMLVRGKHDRRSNFHTPTLGTIGIDGAPQVRTVVLRDADRETRLLRFHTDRRAGKIAEIENNPAVCMHFYDKKAKIQLRVLGTASLHIQDDLKDQAWSGSQPMSRECYRVDTAPGTPVSSGDAWTIPRDLDDDDVGKENFVAVTICVSSIEWLYLARGGHRRARFEFNADGGVATSEWLVP